VWANEVNEQKLHKAIYLVSKWSWTSQWKILLHWCAKLNSLSTRHFTSRLKCDLKSWRKLLNLLSIRRLVARFWSLERRNTFLGGHEFCFYYIFERNFSGNKKIFGGTKEIWGCTAPECPSPVATGLSVRYWQWQQNSL